MSTLDNDPPQDDRKLAPEVPIIEEFMRRAMCRLALVVGFVAAALASVIEYFACAVTWTPSFSLPHRHQLFRL